MGTDQLGRLRDILHAARLAQSYVHDIEDEDFYKDTEKQDAVIRRIEIIGEASRHLSDETRRALPDLPFRKIRGMRNFVAHDYGNVDLTIVWNVVSVELTDVIHSIEGFFAKIGEDPNR